MPKRSKEYVSELTCRGIKSSMNDPIKLIQKVLDKVYSHLLYDIEHEFWRLYGKELCQYNRDR